MAGKQAPGGSSAGWKGWKEDISCLNPNYMQSLKKLSLHAMSSLASGSGDGKLC